MYAFITRSDRYTENVTEWCKKAACWEKAQREHWTIATSFIHTLVPDSITRAEQTEAKETQKIGNEVDDLKLIMAYGSDYWNQVIRWAKTHTGLSDMEESILKLVASINTTGRIPSVKQAKVALKTRERLISDGMPLQF